MAGLCCRQVVPSGPAQVQTCHVGSRPVPGGGAVGYCVPFGWPGLFRCLGAQRPGGPAYPAGVPISPEKWGERGPGASPLDPRFYSPLVPTRSFWRLWRIVPVEGLLRAPCTCPDLERFFVLVLNSMRVGPFPSTKPPLPARPAGGRAVTGVRQMGRRPGKKRRRTPAGSPQTRKGGSREEEPLPPWCSFLRLSSKESRAPARGRAGNGALRPEAGTSPAPGGYAVPPRIPTPQVLTCGGPRRDHLPTAEALGPTWGP